MGQLVCSFSPLVFAELYRLLDTREDLTDRLADQLDSINLSYAWLEEAAEAYATKWKHDVDYLTPKTLDDFALDAQHAEFASWLLSGLHFSGAPDDLSADLQSAVMARALEDIPDLETPMPPELSPVIVAWTLGRVISTCGDDTPIVPAVLPSDENARLAFTGLVEHLLVLQTMTPPWPEMMCTSMYWRGYGIAEALRPELSSGGEALKQLHREAYNSMPQHQRNNVQRHMSEFGARRNALSHVADMEGRPRFTEVATLAREKSDLELTVQAMGQFVFQEVARQLREQRPKVVRNEVWENLYRDLQTEW